MAGREVEAVEVVVRRLDLAAVDNPVAEPEEDVLHLPPDLRDQVQAPPRIPADRERHVDALLGETAVQLLAFERLGTRGDCGLDAPLRLVQRPAGLRVPDLPQGERKRALPAQILDADELDLVARRRRGDRREGRTLERLDVHGTSEASK